jgi:hypothetical protein
MVVTLVPGVIALEGDNHEQTLHVLSYSPRTRDAVQSTPHSPCTFPSCRWVETRPLGISDKQGSTITVTQRVHVMTNGS